AARRVARWSLPMTQQVGSNAMGEQFDAPAEPSAIAGEIGAARAPEKMAANKVLCDACPVLCQISEGRLGACDRWGNVGGVLTRMDPVVLLKRGDVEVTRRAVGADGAPAWDGKLIDDAPVFVSGVGSGTTYPDYKPAPFIVGSRHNGVDLVTV